MRLPGWQQRLAAKVEEWRFREFRWGETDCLQFVAECVHAITGIDHRERFPRYRGQLSACRILTRLGGMETFLTSIFGEPKPVAFAQEGDLLLADLGIGPTAVVCMGLNYCGPGGHGLTFRRTSTAMIAWSV